MTALVDAWASRAAAEQLLAVAWLLAVRLLPLALLVPAFGVRGAPAAWLLTATFALVAALLPSATATAPSLPVDVASLLLLSLRELCLGGLYAVALALPFLALEWGGRLADQARGGVPGGRGPSALGDIYLWLGIAAFLALGGHRVVIAALADGLASHPLGAQAAHSTTGGLGALAMSSARLGADALGAAARVAAPVLAVLVLFEVALGVVGRTAPAFPAALTPAKSWLGLSVALMGSAVLLGSLPATFSHALDTARRVAEAAP